MAPRFYLDFPLECPTYDRFSIQGWYAGSEPLRGVRFKDYPDVALGIFERPDVAAAFPECPQTSGFRGLAHHAPQDGTLALEFLLGDEWVTHRYLLKEPQLNSSAPAAGQNREYHPEHDPDVTYVTPADAEPRFAPDGLAYPPLSLCSRVGSHTLESYWSVGESCKKIIVQSLPRDWTFAGKRILDFGCGAGRVIRHFADQSPDAEFWGCDIDLPSIMWMNRHFSPPFRIFQNSEDPALPLESNSFDLIYATSVFTHLNTTWNQWLMELRRILRPGGYAFLSFLHRAPYELAYCLPFPEKGLDMLVKHPGQPWDRGGPSVFNSPEWLIENWGGVFDIDYIALEGLGGFQSIAMVRKPAPFSQPKHTKPPIHSTGVRYALNPDARAIIEIPDRPNVHLLDSYGLRGWERIRVKGWAALRGSEVATVNFVVNGTSIARIGAESIRKDGAMPELMGAPYCVFEHALDVTTLAPGACTLRIEFSGIRGETHWAEAPLVREK